jgi:hypothetical protein
MTVTFRPAKRENVPLLLGLAGGTGSGKTLSALLLARGLAGGQPFAGIDTENGRMSHYADDFPELMVAEITAPFRPDKYIDAIESAEKAGYRVIVVDSMSHEWYGDGGCLDWHEDLMGGNQTKNLSAWIEPKKAHKHMVTRLLQVNAHVILCFRAEPKVEAVKVNGKTEIVPKRTLTGLDGWVPITEKNLPFEMTASFLLMADQPGVPKPIKLNQAHRPFFPLDRPITVECGVELARWSLGSNAAPAPAPAPADADGPLLITEPQRRLLFATAGERGVDQERLKALVLGVAGVDSSRLIPRALVDRLLERVNAEVAAAPVVVDQPAELVSPFQMPVRALSGDPA